MKNELTLITKLLKKKSITHVTNKKIIKKKNNAIINIKKKV